VWGSGHEDGDRDDDGTLGVVKSLKRTVDVVRQAGHSMLRQWRLGLVSRVVEQCLMPQALEVRCRCPATRGLQGVWSQRNPRLRLRGSLP
jgi:hypothetical protein